MGSSMFRRAVPIIFLSLLLPNLVFQGASLWLGIGRPYINLDYAFVMLLLAFGWSWLGVLLGLVFLLLDVLVLTGQVLPFARMADVFYLLRFAASASSFHLVLLIMICMLVLLKWHVLVKLGRNISQLTALSLFNCLVIIYAVHASGSSGDGDRFYRVAGGAWVASQAVVFLQSRTDGFLGDFQDEGEALTSLAIGGATALWPEVPGERLLLVVAESWGEPVDARIQRALLEGISERAGKSLEQGSLPFVGVTLGGELRELCRLHPNRFSLSTVTKGFEKCLPNRLKSQGYMTAAMHGAMGLMYDRQYWYPRVGFERSVFFESKLWPHRCHSFPGACDLDLFQDVDEFFAQPGKRFFYWLTLNSHSRYDPRDIRLDLFDCEKFGVPVGSESCRNLKLQAQFFHGLGELVGSNNMVGVDVIVVGDHSPVIMNLDEKKRIFVGDRVPWVRFRVE